MQWKKKEQSGKQECLEGNLEQKCYCIPNTYRCYAILGKAIYELKKSLIKKEEFILVKRIIKNLLLKSDFLLKSKIRSDKMELKEKFRKFGCWLSHDTILLWTMYKSHCHFCGLTYADLHHYDVERWEKERGQDVAKPIFSSPSSKDGVSEGVL